MTKDTKEKDGFDPRLYDVRNLERNLKRGVISRKDYEKYLKSLQDARDKVKPPPDVS